MAGQGLPVEVACRVLGVSCAGFYAWRFRPPSPRAVRHAWLTDLIREIHAASYGAYGANRVHAELVLGREIRVGHCSVAMLMQRAGIKGRTGSPKRRGVPGLATADDLVDRVFHRNAPNQLWLTDVTEHPTREGKVYCAVVLDAFSRRVVGWSISHSPTAALTTNALGMAIEQRDAAHGKTVIHSDHGTAFTAWAFTDRARRSGLVPSMGSVGDCYDNAMIEAFWSRMQIELLDTRRWKTRVELANAIFEYIEIFHNRRRRHSALGMRTPIEYELINNTTTPAAA
jgi:transposase InsO family protein